MTGPRLFTADELASSREHARYMTALRQERARLRRMPAMRGASEDELTRYARARIANRNATFRLVDRMLYPRSLADVKTIAKGYVGAGPLKSPISVPEERRIEALKAGGLGPELVAGLLNAPGRLLAARDVASDIEARARGEKRPLWGTALALFGMGALGSIREVRTAQKAAREAGEATEVAGKIGRATDPKAIREVTQAGGTPELVSQIERALTDPSYTPAIPESDKLVARWESKGGKDWVELYQTSYRGEPSYHYRASSGGGNLGSDDVGLRDFLGRINDFQADANKTPMRVVRGEAPTVAPTPVTPIRRTPAPPPIYPMGPDAWFAERERLVAENKARFAGMTPEQQTAEVERMLRESTGGVMTKPQGIEEAAIRLPDGRVFRGRLHQFARDKAEEAGVARELIEQSEDGFVTDAGTFVDRERAADILGVGPGPLEAAAMDVIDKPAAQRPDLEVATFERRLNPELRKRFSEIAKEHATAKGETGSTTDPRTGRAVSSGYIVSPFKEREFVVRGRINEQAMVERLRLFAARNADLLKDERNMLGTWYDPKADETILDVVQAHPNTAEGRQEALRVGREAKQEAVYHADKGETIPVGTAVPTKELAPLREIMTKPSGDLRASIAKSGIKEPITIEADPSGHMVVTDGAHRLAAAEELGLKDVPVIFKRSDVRKDVGVPTTPEIAKYVLPTAALAAASSEEEGPGAALAAGALALPTRGATGRLARTLLEDEARLLTTGRGAARAIEQFDRAARILPPAEAVAAGALAGEAGRAFYSNSAKALVEKYGPDAPRFAALLAATSPQTRVENNLEIAQAIWDSWNSTGRPQDAETIRRLVKPHKLVADIAPNVVRAFTAPDPATVKLSGPKVGEFYQNLMGDTQRVTLDTWMSQLGNVDFRSLPRSVREGGKERLVPSGTYLAWAGRHRETADYLTRSTGRQWSPTEVQAALWAWGKALGEDIDTGVPPVRSRGMTPEQRARVGQIAAGRLAPRFPEPEEITAIDFAKLLGAAPAETPTTTTPTFMQDERSLRLLARNMARSRLGDYALGFGATAAGGGLLARERERRHKALLAY